MRLTIFTSVEHVFRDNKFYGYGPYIREMNIWIKYVDEVVIVAPKSKNGEILPMDLHYEHPKLQFVEIPSFNLTTFPNVLKTLVVSPLILYRMIKVLRKVDQVHLRCPSNTGLLGCVAQIFFPKLKKSTKFAGNWDPNSNQPLSYRLQKKLLANTTLTKNIKVLVYGEWPNQTKNIVPFISATYYEHEIEKTEERDYTGVLNFVFVGSIVVGKRPILTIKIIEELNRRRIPSQLELFGEGTMFEETKAYIDENNLKDVIFLRGNQDKETVKQSLKKAHFNILPSKSEGWPKAVAEGMFFGAIPIATRISCLDWMLDYGNRGILIEPNVKVAADSISQVLKDADLHNMATKAVQWSQQYTLDTLEEAIRKTIEE
ncbi:glycosyltransferase family 4 protein [Winogradskyella luteola]|uniref:Glycosyltransferase family 4 protein n=1 Tax=Winogradskyella luteola TaxID=2828330 RepID=A0A9X1F725_9FLAO|nr:glycosyltransferase family 4 protein [Winogradskyella luteola]MBV7268560.1 glycosyltransferase family 4 protein [Winogradskyella luteola]